MRFLMGWALKLSIVGVVYLGMTSGFKVKLPEEVLGYKVPATAQQWVDRNAQIGEFGAQPELWVPFQLDPHSVGQGHYFRVAGRLKPGVSVAQAKARLKLSADEYKVKFPNVLAKEHGFLTAFLSAWGAAMDRRRVRRA